MSFYEGLSENLTRAITDMGFEEPTPIQASAIPAMMEGKDMIGRAQTGTGKTAAFGIPLVEKADPADAAVRALILSPTRELAMQIAGELAKLAKYKTGVRVVCVYGGQPIERQLRSLAMGPQIVVGTPGRVMDHMRRGSLDLSQVRTVVLDEADEMLDMGFREDMEAILSETPEERQTALFSATMPRPILMMSRRFLKDPVMCQVENATRAVENIEQSYISVRSFHKVELLTRLLIRDNVTLGLIFCNTKMEVEQVVTELHKRGFSVAGLHGDMRQIERDAIMGRFRSGLIELLVATDVAARGLDVDNIQTVFNYDLPQDAECYTHRVGRTGRAGREGRAYTFVVGREVSRMWEYRRITGAKILCEKAPSPDDVQKVQLNRVLQEISAHAEIAHEQETYEAAKQLLANMDPEVAATAMLSMIIRATGARVDEAVDLTPPEPVKRQVVYPFKPAGSAPRYGRPPRGPKPAQDVSDRFEGGKPHDFRKSDRPENGKSGHFRKSDRPERSERSESGKHGGYHKSSHGKPAPHGPKHSG